jgi:hypothetical protein
VKFICNRTTIPFIKTLSCDQNTINDAEINLHMDTRDKIYWADIQDQDSVLKNWNKYVKEGKKNRREVKIYPAHSSSYLTNSVYEMEFYTEMSIFKTKN